MSKSPCLAKWLNCRVTQQAYGQNVEQSACTACPPCCRLLLHSHLPVADVPAAVAPPRACISCLPGSLLNQKSGRQVPCTRADLLCWCAPRAKGHLRAQPSSSVHSLRGSPSLRQTRARTKGQGRVSPCCNTRTKTKEQATLPLPVRLFSAAPKIRVPN